MALRSLRVNKREKHLVLESLEGAKSFWLCVLGWTDFEILHRQSFYLRSRCGTGIWCFFEPWIGIWDRKNPDPGSGMNTPNLILENLVPTTDLFFELLNSLTRNAASGIRVGKNRIRYKHPGSATMLLIKYTFGDKKVNLHSTVKS